MKNEVCQKQFLVNRYVRYTAFTAKVHCDMPLSSQGDCMLELDYPNSNLPFSFLPCLTPSPPNTPSTSNTAPPTPLLTCGASPPPLPSQLPHSPVVSHPLPSQHSPTPLLTCGEVEGTTSLDLGHLEIKLFLEYRQWVASCGGVM